MKKKSALRIATRIQMLRQKDDEQAKEKTLADN